MFRLNQKIKYVPNRGRWIQRLKTSDIVEPKVVVNSKGLGFKTSYLNPFDEYAISFLEGGSEAKHVMNLWDNDPLGMYTNCINFAVFCATSGVGISLEHFNSSQPLVSSIMRFHLYYHVRRILYLLKVKLPLEKGFNRYNTNYDKDAFREICADYGVEGDFRNGYIFSSFQGSQLTYLNRDSWSRWIMPKSQGLTKQGVEMLSASVRIYVYCLLTAQSSTRSNIIGNTAPNFEAQKLFPKEVEDFVKRDMLLHEDIRRYEGILSNARSAVDFSLGEGIYMLPSDLQLKVSVKQGFSDKLKVGGEKTGIVPHVAPRASPVTLHDRLRLSYEHAERHKVQQRVQHVANTASPLTLQQQRLSKEHKDELDSLVLFGSLSVVGVVYFLKTR